MNWEAAIGRQSDALTRILLALAAMAGLLAVARLSLPRNIHRAVLRPLLAAQAAALPFADADSISASGYPGLKGSDAAALLRRRFAALARAIADLIRKLLAPQPGGDPDRRSRRGVRAVRNALRPFASWALKPDTS